MNTREENKATARSSAPSEATGDSFTGGSFTGASPSLHGSSSDASPAAGASPGGPGPPGGSRKMYHRNAEKATIPKMGSA